MKTEAEVRQRIADVEKAMQYVLDAGPATFDINAPRAAMQLSVKSELETLAWILGEKRKRFPCDDRSKLNR